MINWHSTQWSELFRDGMESLLRLPHALLLSGRAGLGKSRFAEELAAVLLCEAPLMRESIPAACGKCQGCHWLQGANHPDYRRVSPDNDDCDDDGEGAKKEKKKGAAQIKVEAIRELEDFVFVGSHRHGRRVIVIHQADAMNAVTANALLKILEEPPATVYFILVTSHPRRLLPTIRSRTRQLAFHCPDASAAKQWLAQNGVGERASRYLSLAGGAPLTVLQWQEDKQIDALDALTETLLKPGNDPLSLAAQWDALLKKHVQFSLEMLVEGIQRWLHDLALQAVAQAPRYVSEAGKVVPVSETIEARLSVVWREILRFRRSARHPLNQLLFLEDLATHALRAVSGERVGGG